MSSRKANHHALKLRLGHLCSARRVSSSFITSLVVLLGAALPATAASWYPNRLDDPTAVYLTPDKFPVHADGSADDSAALQQAIDKVQESTGEGIVFVPSGRYRITRTIYVWPSVRVIGYGPTRPVLVLAKDTPGFQQGMAYMVLFAGGRPGHERTALRNPPAGQQANGRRNLTSNRDLDAVFPGTVPPATGIVDANPGTFYSAMSNIDFEIGVGNPAAVGIRLHVAQH